MKRNALALNGIGSFVLRNGIDVEIPHKWRNVPIAQVNGLNVRNGTISLDRSIVPTDGNGNAITGSWRMTLLSGTIGSEREFGFCYVVESYDYSESFGSAFWIMRKRMPRKHSTTRWSATEESKDHVQRFLQRVDQPAPIAIGQSETESFVEATMRLQRDDSMLRSLFTY